MAKKEKPGLKKSDLLAALKNKKGENREDLTKEKLQNILSKDFEFIPQYFDYLFAMYENGGKFEQAEENEDGDCLLTIKAVGQVRTSPRTIYEVSVVDGEDEDENDVLMVECESQTLQPGDKLPDTHSLSKVSAVKIAVKASYARYKAERACMEAWLLLPDEDAEDAQEAA